MLKRLKELSLNLSAIVFIAFSVKMLLITPSFADSLIVLVFSALYGYSQYLKRFQPYNLDKEVAKDLHEVKSALSKLNFIQASEKLKNKKYF